MATMLVAFLMLSVFAFQEIEGAPGGGNNGNSNAPSPCLSSPCLNGGSCKSNGGNNKYSCKCTPGYLGKHCEEECGLLDVSFVLDMSGSIGRYNWDVHMIGGFIDALVGAMPVDEGKAKIGTALYATAEEVFFDLEEYSTREDIIDAFDDLDFMCNRRVCLGGRWTNTEGGIIAGCSLFNVSRGDRPEVPNILIVVTDGKSNVGYSPGLAAESCRKRTASRVIAVGIGGYNLTELRSIADVDPLEPDRYVFTVGSFSQLKRLKEKILKLSCIIGAAGVINCDETQDPVELQTCADRNSSFPFIPANTQEAGGALNGPVKGSAANTDRTWKGNKKKTKLSSQEKKALRALNGGSSKKTKKIKKPKKIKKSSSSSSEEDTALVGGLPTEGGKSLKKKKKKKNKKTKLSSKETAGPLSALLGGGGKSMKKAKKKKAKLSSKEVGPVGALPEGYGGKSNKGGKSIKGGKSNKGGKSKAGKDLDFLAGLADQGGSSEGSKSVKKSSKEKALAEYAMQPGATSKDGGKSKAGGVSKKKATFTGSLASPKTFKLGRRRKSRKKKVSSKGV